VAAGGGGDLERALGALLALDVEKVGHRGVRLRAPWGCGRDSWLPLKWLASAISEPAAMISISEFRHNYYYLQ
jgi:hypothetical protein